MIMLNNVLYVITIAHAIFVLFSLLFYREVNGHLDNELERRQNSQRLKGRYEFIQTWSLLLLANSVVLGAQ